MENLIGVHRNNAETMCIIHVKHMYTTHMGSAGGLVIYIIFKTKTKT